MISPAPPSCEWPKASFRPGLGKEFPLPVAQALRHGDRAVPVAFHDSLDPLEELLLVELDLGKKEYLRRVAFRSAARPQAAVIHPRACPLLHHEDPRRSLRHRGKRRNPLRESRSPRIFATDPKPGQLSVIARSLSTVLGMPTQTSGYPSFSPTCEIFQAVSAESLPPL